MNDRELLELAAKAAEIKGNWHEGANCFWTTRLTIFDPLHDDAQALRLAVKLEILVLTARGFAVANATDSGGTCERLRSEPDPYAATRRAIVRAAAEIGKEMK